MVPRTLLDMNNEWINAESMSAVYSVLKKCTNVEATVFKKDSYEYHKLKLLAVKQYADKRAP